MKITTAFPITALFLLMPFIGEVKWEGKEYRSSFSHKNEEASSGYYEMLLDKDKIRAQPATSVRSGMLSCKAC